MRVHLHDNGQNGSKNNTNNDNDGDNKRSNDDRNHGGPPRTREAVLGSILRVSFGIDDMLAGIFLFFLARGVAVVVVLGAPNQMDSGQSVV